MDMIPQAVTALHAKGWAIIAKGIRITVRYEFLSMIPLRWWTGIPQAGYTEPTM